MRDSASWGSRRHDLKSCRRSCYLARGFRPDPEVPNRSIPRSRPRLGVGHFGCLLEQLLLDSALLDAQSALSRPTNLSSAMTAIRAACCSLSNASALPVRSWLTAEVATTRGSALPPWRSNPTENAGLSFVTHRCNLFGNRARVLLVCNHEDQNCCTLVDAWISRC
jgi:hypothetical protein